MLGKPGKRAKYRDIERLILFLGFDRYFADSPVVLEVSGGRCGPAGDAPCVPRVGVRAVPLLLHHGLDDRLAARPWLRGAGRNVTGLAHVVVIRA